VSWAPYLVVVDRLGTGAGGPADEVVVVTASVVDVVLAGGALVGGGFMCGCTPHAPNPRASAATAPALARSRPSRPGQRSSMSAPPPRGASPRATSDQGALSVLERPSV